MPIRVCAIEVSHWHSLYDPAYLRQLARMDEVELVGLSDPDPRVAAHRAEEVGGPPVFGDAEQMLDQRKPDFVLALGRHSSMAATAHMLLDRGLPFVMEKPMGVNAGEVRTIADRVAETGAFVAVPMPFRYSAFHAKARELLDGGGFGPLSHVYVRQNRFTSQRYPDWDSPWMLDPAQAGGGSLRNLGPHGLDMFLQLTGPDATVVACQMSNAVHRDPVEDYVTVLLRSSDGVLGTIEVGTSYPRKPGQGAPNPRDRLPDGADAEWAICGRDAMVSSKDGELRVTTADSEESHDSAPPVPPSYRMLQETLRCWQAGKPPPAGVEDCWRVNKLVDEAYALAR
ncbi:MAG: Gfo/Idh/MocA family oxidoreductase [Alphaproteobacteria bacterium]